MISTEQLIYSLPGMIAALTFHEYAHAAVAYYRGDDTAKQLGRLTANPLKHLDPLGSFLILYAGFGWAKPVPVNPLNLVNPKKDMVWVSLAGPMSNMIMAIIAMLSIRVLLLTNIPANSLIAVLYFAMNINLVLAGFNLLPLQPLDGSKIVMGILPHYYAIRFEEFTRHGPVILMGLMIMGSITNFSPIWSVLSPWMSFWSTVLLGPENLHSIRVILHYVLG